MTTTYHNLKEFIEGRWFDFHEGSMYEYGRCLYKYTFGPWISYQIRDGEDVYYEDTDASTGTLEYADKCTGITVGSIIEGADFDAPPFTLEFPFTDQEYSDALDALEEYVNSAWQWANSTYYSVTSPTGHRYWYQWVQFDDEPKGDFVHSDTTEEEKEAAKKIAIAAGLLVINEGKTSGNVPGYPGWTVQEEESDVFEY